MLSLENLRHLKQDRFTKVEIADKAAEFLSRYFSEYRSIYSATPAIPIEDIIDVRLGIELSPWTGLQSKSGIGSDAFLEYHEPPRRSVIHFDEQYTRDDLSLTRFRFTLAHEVAHWHLHSGIYHCVVDDKITTPVDFYKRYEALSDDCRDWMDRQANWFAKDILVPSFSMKFWFQRIMNSEKDRIGNLLDEEKSEEARKSIVRDYFSEEIGNLFEVSKKVAEIALNGSELIETFWDQIANQ